ncbi:MAG: T9SS type A sorting domain-containing protein [Flavobacteriales bacterium]|nr:T9SS type A sorting domain-containing protein [Flavobacteriales bacterium]
MKKTILFTSLICGILILSYPQMIIGFQGGSPGGKTNSPMDGGNCTMCHAGTLNSGQGAVSISTDIPSTGYIPGDTYTITVEVSHPSFTKYGFELTAESFNMKVGGFTITNSSQTKLANGNNSVTHKSSGTLGSATKTWTVNWTAPVAGQMTVDFYAASVTANGNEENTGDNVYTTSHTVNENVNTAITTVSENINMFSYNDNIKIEGNKNLSSVKIYDLSGKMVSNHINLMLPATISTSNFSSGIYIINTTDINGNQYNNKINIK